MNKYICPICDLYSEQVWNQVILARSLSDCQEKLMHTLIEDYNFDDNYTWSEFLDFLNKQEILVGEITDIETL